MQWSVALKSAIYKGRENIYEYSSALRIEWWILQSVKQLNDVISNRDLPDPYVKINQNILWFYE